MANMVYKETAETLAEIKAAEIAWNASHKPIAELEDPAPAIQYGVQALAPLAAASAH